MSWTKRELVVQAYGELALAGYVFDIEPEEIQFAVVTMDVLMAQWADLGIHLGYALGHSPTDTDPDDASGVQLGKVRAVYLNVAVAIAASKGKQLPASTLKNAKDAYDVLTAAVARSRMQRVQMPYGVPAGAGNRVARRGAGPFLPVADTSPLQTGDNGDLEFLGS